MKRYIDLANANREVIVKKLLEAHENAVKHPSCRYPVYIDQDGYVWVDEDVAGGNSVPACDFCGEATRIHNFCYQYPDPWYAEYDDMEDLIRDIFCDDSEEIYADFKECCGWNPDFDDLQCYIRDDRPELFDRFDAACDKFEQDYEWERINSFTEDDAQSMVNDFIDWVRDYVRQEEMR